MKKFLFRRRQQPNRQHAGGFTARLQILYGLLKKLADLLRVTEEEQIEAIYLGDQR